MLDALVLYTYTFDFGSRYGYAELARRLLKAGIAESLVDSRTGEVRLADRYRELAGQLDFLRQIGDSDGTLSSAFNLGSGVYKWRMRAIVLVSVVRAAVSIVTRRTQDSTAERDDSSGFGRFQEESNQLSDAIRRDQIFELTRHGIDRDLYPPEYLAEAPFYRLRLRPVDAAISILGRSAQTDPSQRIDVSLTLHRSGVALLTFSFAVQRATSLSELGAATRSAIPKVDELRVSKSIVALYAKWAGAPMRALRGTWESDISEGDHWINLQTNEGSVFADIFQIYHEALSEVFRESLSPVWLCQPTISINHLGCCQSRSKWMSAHQFQLGLVLAGVSEAQNIRVGALGGDVLHDHSLTEDESFFTVGSTAVVVNWEFGQEHTWSSVGLLFRLIVIENALIRYWQLRNLDARMNRGNDRQLARSADALQAQLIFGIAEQDKVSFVAQTASDLSDVIFANLRGPRLLAHVTDRIGLLAGLVAAQEARSASSRSIRLTAGALVAALVLGLPAISQALDVVRKFPILDISNMEAARYSVIIYLVLLAGALLACLPPSRRLKLRPTRRRVRASSVGYEWPDGQLDVTLVRRGIDETRTAFDASVNRSN